MNDESDIHPSSFILPLMCDESDDITRMLADYRGGDRDAFGRLLPLLYGELRRIAARRLRGERSGHTLQPTDLVHEAYLKLADQRDARWQNRAHFYGAAARVMRNILVDYARTRLAGKRGGGAVRVTLVDAFVGSDAPDVDVIALDDALRALAEFDPQKCRIVELRYFGGLSIEETAEAVGISTATVKREWTVAKVWLHQRLTGGSS
jgi:RNA polymerase sigma factor (TIGR02999 family)